MDVKTEEKLCTYRDMGQRLPHHKSLGFAIQTMVIYRIHDHGPTENVSITFKNL